MAGRSVVSHIPGCQKICGPPDVRPRPPGESDPGGLHDERGRAAYFPVTAVSPCREMIAPKGRLVIIP